MNLLAPAALWLALSLPLVVLLYLLKRRRAVRLVSSTLLWQRFLAESQANSPFQKFRNHALMWLQLLLLALAILALARPYLGGNVGSSRLRVLVLDGSASMQSTDASPSRFERAKAEARTWIDGLRDQEQAMILLAGATTQVRQSPTRDKLALRRALEACNASDGSTRLIEALQTASSFTFEKRGEETATTGEIHLFSDGAAPDLSALGNKNLPLVFHRIGGPGRNIGIISLDVRADPVAPQRRALLAGILNAHTQSQRVQVELLFDNRIIETKAIELPPTNNVPLLFLAQQTEDGVFTLRIQDADDLKVDNQASVHSTLPRPISILLITHGNRFLEKGLKACPQARVSVADQVPDGATDYDIVVLDQILPKVWPKASVLAIGVHPPHWFEATTVEKNPAIVDWNQSHPILRHVNLDTVDLAESQLVNPPPWAIQLVQSQKKALMIAGERDLRRVIWMGFDPLQSNWPLRVSFPIFLANAVEWLNPVSVRSAGQRLRVGEPIRQTWSNPILEAKLTRPDGQSILVPTQQEGRELFYGNTDRSGLYTVLAGTNRTVFCVNLLDAAETSIAAQDRLSLGRSTEGEGASLKKAPQELWRWLAGLALIVLLLEWGYYHHRTA